MGFWSRIADFARRRSGEADADSRLWGEIGDGGTTASGAMVNSGTAMRDQKPIVFQILVRGSARSSGLSVPLIEL